MTEFIYLGTGLLALILMWRCILLPTLKLTYKDKLVAERAYLRAYFAKRGKLHHPVYIALRDDIDRAARFIDRAGFSVTYKFGMEMRSNPEFYVHYLNELNERYQVDGPELAPIVKAIRKKSRRIIRCFVFHSSFYSVFALYILFVPVASALFLIATARKGALRGYIPLSAILRRFMRSRFAKRIEPSHAELFAQLPGLCGA